MPTRSSPARSRRPVDRLFHLRPRQLRSGRSARYLPGRARLAMPPSRVGLPAGRPERFPAREPPAPASQMTAIDIDGDGDIDLVCPGKSRPLPLREPHQIQIDRPVGWPLRASPTTLCWWGSPEARPHPTRGESPMPSDDPPLRPRQSRKLAPRHLTVDLPAECDRSTTSRPPSPSTVPGARAPLVADAYGSPINSEYALDDHQTIPLDAELAVDPARSAAARNRHRPLIP